MKRQRPVREFCFPFTSCLKVGFFNFLKSPCPELTWFEENGHGQVNANAFLAMLPMFYNFDEGTLLERGKEAGKEGHRERDWWENEFLLLLLFPFWQKLWTFGDNHS